MSPLRVLLLVSLALLLSVATAKPLFDGGVMQPARVSAPLMRFMQAKSLAAAKATASVEGPWFAEVSWAGDVAKKKPEERAFKDFDMTHDQIKQMLKDLLALDNNGKPTHKWYAMNWKKAKLAGGDDLIAFKKYRATFVQAIAFLVKVAGNDPCPYCMVRGSGSEDPGSDIDLAAVGWGANTFVRSFNTLFETVWPQAQTAADVFDVNVYADCWVWPKSANINLKDEESKSKAEKAQTAVNLLMARGKDGKDAEKVPLCFTEQKMNDDMVYVYTVQKADAAADEKNQRVWALVHWIYYKLEDLYHHVAAVPLECTLHATHKLMTEKCPTIEKLFQGGSSAAATAYNADFSAAVAKLLSLAQSPCAAFDAYCSKPPPAATQSYSKAVMMHNVKNRNALNFEALDRLYTAIDPAVAESKAAADKEGQTQYCLKSKNLMSEAAWWSQEAYLTKGAINHVVHSGQAGAAISWISRSEFFDSFLENYGDFQKEVAHDHQPGPNAAVAQRIELGEAFTVKASKYISRMFDSHHRIKKPANAVSQNAQSFSTCAFPPIFVLQKQVRNKVSNQKIVAASKCAVAEILACVKTYTNLPAATVVLENDLLTHAVNMFAREVITHFYSGYVAGEANNKAVALEKDEGIFTPSQCTIR